MSSRLVLRVLLATAIAVTTLGAGPVLAMSRHPVVSGPAAPAGQQVAPSAGRAGILP